MKLNVRPVLASSCVAVMLFAVNSAKAQSVTASVWANGTTASVPTAGSSLYSTTPTAVLNISNANPSSVIDFYSSTDTSLTGFFTTAPGGGSNGDTVTYTSGSNQSNINNDVIQFTGTTTLSTGSYTISHDDGAILYLNGTVALDDPGPTNATNTAFTVCASGCDATPGTYSFVLDYAEVQGPPAQLTVTLPTSATPEPSSFLLLGSSLIGAAGILRRRMKI